MASEPDLSFSVVSVLEDVLQQQGARLSDIDLASRKAEEASLRRYEAAGWLRKMVGVVGGKDLPAQPSEEEFRLGLRSGIILCNVLNRIQPGAIPKVVEAPADSTIIPDGAALSAYQYFENVRNFLVIVEEMGLPTFEASDLEKSFSRASSVGEKSVDSSYSEQASCGDHGSDLNETVPSQKLNTLIRALLSDKKQEEIPYILESMLNRVMVEFENRLSNPDYLIRTTSRDESMCGPEDSFSRASSNDIEMEDEFPINQKMKEEAQREWNRKRFIGDYDQTQLPKQHLLVEQQQRSIQELRNTLHTTKSGVQLLQVKYQEEFNNLGKHLCGLAHAASGYQRVLEENRKLYNLVQDLKGNIRVYCRVRPFLNGQPNHASTVDHIEEGTITISTAVKYVKDGRKSFSFNKVFGPSATQEEVFTDTKALIRSVLDGYNVCIFAYGQTGSGKTFTMTGPKELTDESVGVNYRALSDLFVLANQRKDTISYEISVQMLEIYNEQVRDLLVTDGLNKRLEIRNSSQNGINVPDANLVPVASTSDVINLMNLGQKNRAVGATAMNDRSSRSHSCLTVHVQGRDMTSGALLRGSMHLVDLAGSERVDKSEVTGDRLKEAQHINKSLSALGDVISSLAQKNSHVPYRNSKLTQLLQDSLGGQAKTLMFVHISPEPEAVGETISTLKFAERVATVELGTARVNKENTDVKELKEQIANLKAALAAKDGDTERPQHSRPSTPEKFRMKSAASYGSHLHSLGDMSSNRKTPTEDAGNLQAKIRSSPKPRRKSLDPKYLLTSTSPTWPRVGIPTLSRKEDDRESASGDWVDKIMVNKDDLLSSDDNLLGQCQLDNEQLSENFCEGLQRDPSKIYPEQPLNRLAANKRDNQDFDLQRNRSETATTDESDHEAAASDCSEPDSSWQSNIPKASSIPSGLKAKTKKTRPKNTIKDQRSQEHDSIFNSFTTNTETIHRSKSIFTQTRRQPVLADTKLKRAHTK